MKKEIESGITKPSCSISAPNVDPVSDSFEPQTPLGKKLLTLRKSYVEKGHPLLNDVEFDKELNSRRGGFFIPEDRNIVTSDTNVMKKLFNERKVSELEKDVNQAIEDFFNNLECKNL